MNIRKLLIFALFVLLWTSIAPTLGQDSDPAFPVTVSHKYGSTTVTEAPQRVVSIGYNEQDPLLALGVTPVAVRYWFGDESNAIFPWAADEAAGAQPTVLNMPFGNLNYEAILALEPDLISAVYSGISQEEYDILSQIAPTLAQVGDFVDFGMPWQDTTIHIGTALGKFDEAKALVAEVEAARASVSEDYPQFQGATVTVAYNWGETYGYYTAQDGRGRFFTDLGFVIPDEHNELAGDQFYYALSDERVDLLDTDLLVFVGLQFYEGGSEAGIAAVNNDPLLSQLDVVQNGRVFFVADEYDAALNFGSILSLQYLLENLVPEIAAIMPEPDEAPSAFPVTVEHKYGSTTISAAPERVVSIGYNEQDPLLALGVTPVAVRYWFGDESNAIFPWAADEAAGAQPTVLNMPYGNLNYEAILALEPDFISAVYSGISQEEYDILSQIAPTLAQVGDFVDFGMPWQDTTIHIGNALGKATEAEALVAEVEAARASVSEDYPQFQGATVTVAYNWGETYGYYTAQDGRGRFFTDLGFVIPDEQNELAGDQFYYALSDERVDLLDQDLLVFVGLQFYEGGSEAGIAAVNNDPLLSQLDVVQNGRVFFVADEYDAALNFGSILSLQFLLENLVPEIAEIMP